MKTLIAILSMLAMLATTLAHAETVTADGPAIKINTKGGLEVMTVDEAYSVKLGGSIQWDYNQSELNGVTDEDEMSIRRARLYVSGKVAGDWSYKAQFNIGNGNGGTPVDLYIQYNGWGKAAKVTVGKQRVVFGLEDLTSSNDITALKRSGITEQYGIARQNSVRLHGEIAKVYYSVSAFEDDGAGTSDDFGFAGRVAIAPVQTDSSLIHLGLGYSDRGNDHSAVGLEFAASLNNFNFQAEYFDEKQGSTDRDGFYAQAGWIITGESRPYKDGVFKRVKPGSPKGAWEGFARLEEGDGNHSDIELGRVDASAYSVGVNYYANNNIRLGINYSEGDSNEAGSNDDGKEFRARLQLAF